MALTTCLFKTVQCCATDCGNYSW